MSVNTLRVVTIFLNEVRFQCGVFVLSLVPRLSVGGEKKKREPGTDCLHMRLIISNSCRA